MKKILWQVLTGSAVLTGGGVTYLSLSNKNNDQIKQVEQKEETTNIDSKGSSSSGGGSGGSSSGGGSGGSSGGGGNGGSSSGGGNSSMDKINNLMFDDFFKKNTTTWTRTNDGLGTKGASSLYKLWEEKVKTEINNDGIYDYWTKIKPKYTEDTISQDDFADFKASHGYDLIFKKEDQPQKANQKYKWLLDNNHLFNATDANAFLNSGYTLETSISGFLASGVKPETKNADFEKSMIKIYYTKKLFWKMFEKQKKYFKDNYPN